MSIGTGGGAAAPRGVSFFSERQFQCGASIAALRMADALSRRGESVTYIYEVQCESAHMGELFPTIMFKHNRGASAPPHSRKGPFSAREQLDAQLRAEVLHHSVRLTHVHNYAGARENIVAIARRRPLVWTMHDTSPVTGYHYRTYGLDDAPLEYKSKLPPASEAFWDSLRDLPFALTAPSRWLTEYARASAPDHILVRHVPNVLPANSFYPMDKKLARALIGIPPEGLFILFFAGKGAWQRKNFEVLARAMVAEPELPISVLVVGGVAQKELLHDHRFIFLNSLDPVRDRARIVALYNAADAFCITSLVDNLPNTVLEAIHCGRPVIASSSGGVPDLVQDGRNGWMFNPRDVESLRAALKRFQADARRHDQMGANSLALARDAFNTASIEAQLLDLYAEMIEIQDCRVGNGAPSVPQPSAVLSSRIPQEASAAGF